MKVAADFPVSFVRMLGTRILLKKRRGKMPPDGLRCGARTDAGMEYLTRILQGIADRMVDADPPGGHH